MQKFWISFVATTVCCAKSWGGTEGPRASADLAVLDANLAVLGAKWSVLDAKLAVLDAKLAVLGAMLAVLDVMLAPRGSPNVAQG